MSQSGLGPSPQSLILAEKVANAVLYEGHILYPYRPSSVKNQQRWTFGGVFPQAYSLAEQGSDPCMMQTECLVQGTPESRLDVRLRFLHVQDRIVGELDAPGSLAAGTADPAFHPVESLRVDEQVFHTWQESVEREVCAASLSLGNLALEAHRQAFSFPDRRQLETLSNAGSQLVGVVVRQQQAVAGRMEIAAEAVGHALFRVAVRVLNVTPWQPAESEQEPHSERRQRTNRDTAIMQAFIATHTLLSVWEGEFVSLLEPPEGLAEAAAACRNTGTWPVLVGEDGERNLVLSSPIILYDYPQIAPESAGDLFDGTEIDEILTLRILTLTDAEKQEVRQTDEHARALLDRTESLPPEILMKLHGVMRSLASPGDEL